MLVAILPACSNAQEHDVVHSLRGDTVVIRGYEDCQECIAGDDERVTIGRAEDEDSPQTYYHIVHANSRYYVGPLHGTSGVGVYDIHGRLLHTMGRQGDGPGEIREVLALAASPAGSVFVLDPINQRVVEFGPDETPTAMISLPARAQSIAVAADTQLLAVMALHQGIEMGHPVHFVNRSGEITKSIGIPMGPYRLDRRYTSYRRVAASRRGTVAVARSYSYSIEVYPSDGKAFFIVRELPWFPQADTISEMAGLGTLWIDENERLWVTTFRRIQEFDPDLSVDERLAGVATYIDTYLEIFDLPSRRLIASKRYDESIIVLNGVLSELHFQPTIGLTSLRVARPRLGSTLSSGRSQ